MTIVILKWSLIQTSGVNIDKTVKFWHLTTVIREHSVVSKNLTMGEKEKGASRFNLTGEQTVTFERFIRTFDGGKFLSTIMLRETSSNIQKKMAWEKFTTAFNAVCKTNFTRIQLHQYHSRVTAKKKKETRERHLQLAGSAQHLRIRIRISF